MQMIPPSGGDTFTGRDGFSYTAATGVTISVGDGAVQQALVRGWTEAAVVQQVRQVTPLTGATVTMQDGEQTLLVTPAGTIAALSVVLPPNPADQTIINLCANQTVTALTLTAGGGRTLNGAATTLGAAAPAEYRFSTSLNAWFRR